MKFGTLIETADNLQLYKYSVHQVAAAYGLSATVLPKPIAGDNGSGMHVHQSIWKDGKPLFAGNGYADLSEMVWSVPEIIADLSTMYTLQQGDVIYMGTPAGVGAVSRGDVLAGGVEGIGDFEVKIA